MKKMFDSFLTINWEEFHFLRPHLLWLLIGSLVILILSLLGLHEDIKWKKLIAPPLRPFVIQKGSTSTKRNLIWTLFILLTIAILGAAGPTWKRIELPGKTLDTPMVILLDLSQSMMASDIQPSRLGRAQFKITDLLNANPQVRGALIAYAGTAHTVVPLSNDYSIIKSHVNSLKPDIMPYPGTNLKAALELADSLCLITTAPGSILLITDDIEENTFTLIQNYLLKGKNTITLIAMNTPAGADVPKANGNGFMKDKNGQTVHSSLNSVVLNKLSSLEGLNISTLTLDNSDMEQLAKDLSKDLEFKEKEEEIEEDWVDEGIWLAIPFAFLLIIWFRKGWVIYSTILLISLSSCQNDSKYPDLWYTKDYQAQLKYEEGEYSDAALLYEDPLHKGIAWYKSGDFEQAIDAFEKDTTAIGAYNLGLAYFQNGDYAAAELAFGKAEEINPKLENASKNKKLMQGMLAEVDDASIEEASEIEETENAQNIQNMDDEDFSGGGQEATEEDMKKERKEETAMTEMRTGKELDEVPPDFKPGEGDDSQKVLMRKVDDDPALFLKRKFSYQAKEKGLRPSNKNIKW